MAERIAMIYIKIHKAGKGSVAPGVLVAMCDSKLIDSVLSEGDVHMDLKTYSSFYKGTLVGKEEAKKKLSAMNDIYSVNAVGEESVEVALDAHLIEKGNVLRVQGVPYAHAYKVDVKAD